MILKARSYSLLSVEIVANVSFTNFKWVVAIDSLREHFLNTANSIPRKGNITLTYLRMVASSFRFSNRLYLRDLISFLTLKKTIFISEVIFQKLFGEET